VSLFDSRYNYSVQKKKILSLALIIFILGWSTFAVGIYFVTQKPLSLQIVDHILSLIWTLGVTLVISLNALICGKLTIGYVLKNNDESVAALALAGGLGLGEMGFLGFGLVALGIANFAILATLQIFFMGLFLWQGETQVTLSQIAGVISQIHSSSAKVPAWMRWAIALALCLTISMTLLPPFEAYDALLYHLTVPALWLRDGGIRAYNITPYWFPSLVEGAYVWGLGLGTDIVPQQLHFLWAVFAFLILWDWTRHIWDDLTAWWVWLLLASMPSLFLLASWAYTDLALTFFSVATLYTLFQGRETKNDLWWRLSAIFAGMAVGVKYTAIIVPCTAGILITLWKSGEWWSWLKAMAQFILICVMIGGIWYLRNWLWMGNPFYPFVFGGLYWDEFRAALYAAPGTGAGWDLLALLSLPLTITLGYQDITFFDGNIGPLYLLALPSALWIIASLRRLPALQRRTTAIIALFSFLSVSFWTYGYVTTKNLWQARLLLPAIIPFAMLAASGIVSYQRLDTKIVRVAFIVSFIAATSTFINIFDIGLRVINRNPLAVALGMISREDYLEKYQPGYAHMLDLSQETPPDSKIYALFEPRSYGITRNIQPDALLDNFLHDIYLHSDPENIIRAWHSQGYTHVLISNRGAIFVLGQREEKYVLDTTLGLLRLVSQSPDKDYSLYEILPR